MTQSPMSSGPAPAGEPEESIVPSAVLSTGHARIDEALARLAGLDEVEIAGHPEQFDAIHQVLRESLASAGRDEDAADGA